jgi:predicted permease
MLDAFITDLRYALRALRTSPGFSVVAVATLALGIGINATMYSFLNAIMFRAMPGVQLADRLVWFGRETEGGPGPRNFSFPDYIDLRDQTHGVLGSVLAFTNTPLSLGGSGSPERIDAQMVTSTFFSVLGVQPQIGRMFVPGSDAVGSGQPEIVLGDRLWRRRFAADPTVIGTTVLVNGKAFAIIGVAPRGFFGPEIGANVQAWVPISMGSVIAPRADADLKNRDASWLNLMGRLAPGADLRSARPTVDAIARRIATSYPATHKGMRVVIGPGTAGINPDNRGEALPLFGLLMGAVGLVLLIACANVANLLLARAASRRKETAIRLALGSGRSRLVRQLLTESLVLSMFGGAGGLLVAFWAADLIVAVIDLPLNLDGSVATDPRVLAFTCTVTVVTALLFGLAPALQSSRLNLVPALKDDGRGLDGRGRSRLQSSLVVAQVALSLVLLATAGLFITSLRRARSADLGFQPRGIAIQSFDLTLQGYSPEKRDIFERQLLERAGSMPGVQSAAIAMVAPMSGTMAGARALVEGGSPDAERIAFFNVISPGFFRTLDIGFVRGRDFTPQDRQGAPLVVIIDEALARRVFVGDALGKRISFDGPKGPFRQVIGIVRTTVADEVGEHSRGYAYLPRVQAPDFGTPDETLLVRGTRPVELSASLTRLLHGMDAALPVYGYRTLSELVQQRMDKQIGISRMLGVVGALALLLASVGLYGVMAYTVARRTHEIGTRMALGARADDVLRLVLSDGFRLTLIGLGVGCALALPLTKLLSSTLYGVSAADLATFGAVGLLLSIVAAFASYVPARRATRVEPIVALRAQ